MFITRTIALISIDPDPAVTAGLAQYSNVYIRQIAHSLAQQGWQVDVFTRRSRFGQPLVEQHSLNCRTVYLDAGPQIALSQAELLGYLPEFIEQFQIFQQRQGLHYPLIHTNQWLAAWIGVELKKRQSLAQVHTCHSADALRYQFLKQTPAIAATHLAVEKTCLETADSVVATSPQDRQDMQALSARSCVEMIPYGVDLDYFGAIHRWEARQRLEIEPGTKLVLYVAQQDQGLETLLQAVHLIREHDFKLVLTGPTLDQPAAGRRSSLQLAHACGSQALQEIAAELGLGDRVTLLGSEAKERSTYFAAADVCVPAINDTASFVAVEAMASGTPVVASDAAGLQFTVVPEVTGLLVPPGDEVALAQAVDRVLSNPVWRDQLGQTARQRAEIAFGWDSVAARLGHLYTRLLSRPVAAQRSRLPVLAS